MGVADDHCTLLLHTEQIPSPLHVYQVLGANKQYCCSRNNNVVVEFPKRHLRATSREGVAWMALSRSRSRGRPATTWGGKTQIFSHYYHYSGWWPRFKKVWICYQPSYLSWRSKSYLWRKFDIFKLVRWLTCPNFINYHFGLHRQLLSWFALFIPILACIVGILHCLTLC